MTKAKHFGVDVSTWNEHVDYAKAVKDGKVEFAYIRAGFGQYAKQKDNMFEAHYKGFHEQGIALGAYQYSYATSPADAVREADAMHGWIKDKDFALPVFLDMEENKVAQLGVETCTMIAKAWMSRMKSYGYEVGVYTNPNWLSNYLDVAEITELGYLWVASWSKTQPDYPNLLMWQFGGEVNPSGTTAVAGIGNVVDQNYYYGELPVIAVDAEEDMTMTVTCTAKTKTLNAQGKPEWMRWIDKGDVCEIRLVSGPLVEITYPTPTGKRTAYLRDLTNFRG